MLDLYLPNDREPMPKVLFFEVSICLVFEVDYEPSLLLSNMFLCQKF